MFTKSVMLILNYIPGPRFWWIGGQDFVEDKVFVWDSTNLNTSLWPYTNFHPDKLYLNRKEGKDQESTTT